MKKFSSQLLLVLIPFAQVFAQNKTEKFEISLPEQKISNSLYKTIEFVDSREDTAQMGFVQLGVFNTKARVVPKIPLPVQLANVINALTDSSAKDGGLIFQLKQFNFAEVTGSVSEKGYCNLRANLYAGVSNQYQKINSIDTVILVKSMDVTKTLLRNGSKIITSFISANLLHSPADSAYYSFNDIINIDSIEKRKLNLYNTINYNEGLYLTYKSFRDQVPDKPITAELKNENISSVRTMDENGKSIKVKAKDVYAVVYKNQPFIATDFGYYPLQKINDDFFFTGKAKVTASAGDVVAASLLFGALGGLLASDAESTFEMKIDYINGGLIRLREIKVPN